MGNFWLNGGRWGSLLARWGWVGFDGDEWGSVGVSVGGWGSVGVGGDEWG